MAFAFLQSNWLWTIELDDFAVDSRANESLAFQSFDDVAEFADLILHHSRKHNDSAVRFVGKNLINNLLRRLPMNGFAGRRIVRLTDRRKKHA